MLLGAAVILIACGPTESNSVSGALVSSSAEPVAGEDRSDLVIVVRSDSLAGQMIGAETPANRFTATDDVLLAAGSSWLWQLSSAPVTNDQATALGRVFGLDDHPRPDDPGFATTQLVGSLDGQVGQLSVFNMAEPTWEFQASSSALAASGARGPVGAASGVDVEAAVYAVMAVIGVEPTSPDAVVIVGRVVPGEVAVAVRVCGALTLRPFWSW